MDIRGRDALVIGLGKSGASAARLLARHGARVRCLDEQPLSMLSAEVSELSKLGIVLDVGSSFERSSLHADVIVVSPGVPNFPGLLAAERSGVPVVSELEIASRFLTAPLALIGGTNGKSTTTALVFEMLAKGGKRTFVGGNFGTPLAEAEVGDWDALVVEISSFQAERVPTMRARAHALLNITDDHLDRYPDFEAYARAKGNPFENMTHGDVAVVPHGDEIVRRQARRGSARLVTFGTGSSADIRIENGQILDQIGRATYSISRMKLRGHHNLLNAAAAIGVATALGAPSGAVAEVLERFEGLPHRTVLVSEISGVRYYDDSKGTNVGASVAALNGLLESRAVLIAGGRDKLGDYGPLVEALSRKGRALVVIGEAGPKIAEAVGAVVPVARASTMSEAVKLAGNFAEAGDAVLLSPACSSFDMFRDYKDRGDAFVRAVREFEESR